MAQALGWPKKQVDFKQIIKLATASNGWASVGAQFGPFKYVHTNPDFSTSGAEAVAGSYYAFAGKREGLTTAELAEACLQLVHVLGIGTWGKIGYKLCEVAERIEAEGKKTSKKSASTKAASKKAPKKISGKTRK